MKIRKTIVLILAVLLLCSCTAAPKEPEQITATDIMDKYALTSVYQIARDPGRFLEDVISINAVPDTSGDDWWYVKETKDYIREYDLASVSIEKEEGSDGKVLMADTDLTFYIDDVDFGKELAESFRAWFEDKWGEPDWVGDNNVSAAWKDKMTVYYHESIPCVTLKVECARYIADGVVTDY